MIKTYTYKGKNYKINCSAIISVHFYNEYKKNIFEVFKNFVEESKKTSNLFSMNPDLLQDVINISFLMLKHGDNKIDTIEDYYNNFEYLELLEVASEITTYLIGSTKTTHKQKVGYKGKKKRGK